MYYCKNCRNKFEKTQIKTETHGLSSPPFETLALCPFCNSANFEEIIIKHCRCCGARLRNVQKDYCSNECKITAEKLRIQEYKRAKKLSEDPLTLLIKEVSDYNTKYNTKFSYGQYVALIRPKLLKEQKCKRKKNI